VQYLNGTQTRDISHLVGRLVSEVPRNLQDEIKRPQTGRLFVNGKPATGNEILQQNDIVEDIPEGAGLG